MSILEKKKVYFDNYWHEQRIEIVDPRAHERADAALSLLDKKNGRLLDIGCGRGLALDFFASRGFDVTGIDVSPEVIRLIEERGHKGYCADIERDEVAGKYDVILCLEILQQLYNPAAVLKKLKSALDSNGEMIISMPNEFHIVSRLKILFGVSHLGDFRHSHIRLFAPRRDRDLFESLSLEVIKKFHISVVPPKWKYLSVIFRPIAQIMPSLFAISSIYRLKKK